MFLLSSTLPDPNAFASIGWVLVCLAALAVAATHIKGFIRGESGRADERTIAGQPIGVRVDQDAATEQQLNELRREINTTLMDVYTKLNAQANGLAALTAMSGQHNEQIAEIRRDIKELFRNAGGHQ